MALDCMGYEELPVKRTSWVRIATYCKAVVLLIVFLVYSCFSNYFSISDNGTRGDADVFNWRG